jgi:toxin HigB-1
VIKSFKHKGLEKFYTTGSKAGIIPDRAVRLRDQLTALTIAKAPMDMGGRAGFCTSYKAD